MGLIRDEDIDAVQERNNIVEVISEYVPLKKAGKSFKALCPFHQEKTPSFVVDPSKQLFHCFGCGEGGSVFTFVMKMDKLDFPETVRSLADRVGYSLRVETSERAKKRQSMTNRLLEAYEEAAVFYERSIDSEAGARAQRYLRKRGFTKETLSAYRVGFAPKGWDNLLKCLRKKGFDSGFLAHAGLLIQRERNSFYDRFRSRIIFPIEDGRGRVIAFGGRAFDLDANRAEPKYLNSPETPLYHKSSVLYGIYQAKKDMVAHNKVLVVEGYTDVLALHQAGLKHVVATMGTAFTLDHLRLLNRFASTIELVFDSDTAGEAAAERGLGLLGESNVDINVVSLPAGEDPADFVIKHGKEAFERILEQSEPLVGFCLKQALKKYDLDDPNQRGRASSEALSIIALLGSAVAQEDYTKKLAHMLDVSFDNLILEFRRIRQPKKRQDRSGAVPPMLDAGQRAEKELLRVVLQHPDEAGCLGELEGEHFTLPDLRELFSILKAQFKGGRLEAGKVTASDSSETVQRNLSKLMLEPLVVEDRETYIRDIVAQLKIGRIEREVKKLKFELEKINPASDPQRYDFIFRELLRLEQNKRNLRP